MCICIQKNLIIILAACVINNIIKLNKNCGYLGIYKK